MPLHLYRHGSEGMDDGPAFALGAIATCLKARILMVSGRSELLEL